MNFLTLIFKKLSILISRGRFHRELQEEMAFHREQARRDLEAEGMSSRQARRAAARQFGNEVKLREQSGEAVQFRFESVGQDIRYAVRQLWHSPGFTAVITLTLALSIGANSAIFSVIDAVLLKPLPYPQADRLMRLFTSNDAFPRFPVNPWDFYDFRDRNKSFESLAAYTRSDVQLSGAGEPLRLNGFQVTSGFFHTLGLKPQLGLEFDSKSEIPGNGLQVILSDRLWRTRFAADRTVIGRKITLNLQPYTIVGVMPPGTAHPGNSYRAVAYGSSVDVWQPFTFSGSHANRGSHYLDSVGRLKPGVTPEQAQSELNAIMTQLGRENDGDVGWTVHVTPLYQEIVGTNRRILLVLLGAVGMVLLIACANAANLLLGRAAARQREIAVRIALGAPRSRLIRQMLTESMLIALLGGGLGALLAIEAVRALVALLPAGFPRAAEIHVNVNVFAFTFLVSLLTGVLFGFAPALQASRLDPRQGLNEGGRSASGSARQRRLRSALVICEVSLACTLLIGAGLMLRSFLNQLQQNPGFDKQHVLTASIALPKSRYGDEVAAARFYDQLSTALAALPGVESVGIGSDLPWTGYNDNAGFNIEGKQPRPHEEFHGRYHAASQNYFRSLGIPLLHGRFFTEADNKQSPSVWIINQTMATRYWPNEDVVGKRVTFEDKPLPKDWITIVGVVGDVKDTPSSPGTEPAFWWPLPQAPFIFPEMALAVSSPVDLQPLANSVREQVQRLDPALAVADIRQMNQIADAGVAQPRFAFFLVGLFAALAIILAAIGTYGVIAYSVSQRIPEFGLRLALGAPPSAILRLVLTQATRLAVSGAVLGLVVAFALARLVQSLIYDVSASDPLTFAAVGMMVVAIALLACYIPARRATKANPMVALRAE
jgi:predicted permease